MATLPQRSHPSTLSTFHSVLTFHPQVNTGTHAGATPLLIACQNGRVGVAELLLGRADVDVNRATTCKGGTILE